MYRLMGLSNCVRGGVCVMEAETARVGGHHSEQHSCVSEQHVGLLASDCYDTQMEPQHHPLHTLIVHPKGGRGVVSGVS